MSKLLSRCLILKIKVRQLKTGEGIFLVDTGCAVNLIKEESVAPQINVRNFDRITITGITEGSIPSYGSVVLNIFDTPIKFHVMPNDLRVPCDGILGGEFFYQEQATISYSHKAIVTISRPISPILFLNPQYFSDSNDNETFEPP